VKIVYYKNEFEKNYYFDRKSYTMRSWKLTVLMTVVICIIASCKKDNDDSSSGPCIHSFTFLKNGAELTYSYSGLFGTSSTVKNIYDSTSQAGVFKHTIKNISNGATLGTRYMKGCGGWLYNDVTVNIKDSLKNIKEDRALGDEWGYYDPQLMKFNEYKVYKKNVSITVPAGTFTCDQLIYHQEGTINTDTLWWNNTYSYIKYSGFLFGYELTSKNF
jgi:hypothetical protein